MTNKLNLSMSVRDALVALSEGNIGALSVLTQIIRDGEKHDPYCDPFVVLCGLDNASVNQTLYGSRIWQLYKDVCDKKIGKMLLVLRAHQLGFLPWSTLNEAIGDDTRRGKPLENFEELEAKVLAELPDFKVEVLS